MTIVSLYTRLAQLPMLLVEKCIRYSATIGVMPMVNVIFRPYGRKLSLKIRYFPSVWTEIYS